MAPNIDLSDGMIKFEIEYQVHCECGNGLLTESEWEGGMHTILPVRRGMSDHGKANPYT